MPDETAETPAPVDEPTPVVEDETPPQVDEEPLPEPAAGRLSQPDPAPEPEPAAEPVVVEEPQPEPKKSSRKKAGEAVCENGCEGECVCDEKQEEPASEDPGIFPAQVDVED